MKKLSLIALIEASFFAAFAFILDLLISIKPAPNISISIAMIPIFILAFRWGFRASIISGFLWGILQIVLGDAWIATPTQAFIEYFIAFACVGFAGLLYNQIQKELRFGDKKKALGWIIVAVFVGSLARYFWHFLAGVIFFGEYAPEGMEPILFSFAVNGVAMLGSFALCAFVAVLLVSTSPRLIIRKDNTLVIEHKNVS